MGVAFFWCNRPMFILYSISSIKLKKGNILKSLFMRVIFLFQPEIDFDDRNRSNALSERQPYSRLKPSTECYG